MNNSYPSHMGDKREELTEILTTRLIECGWRDQVANMCRNIIQKHGVEHIRLEQIICEVSSKAKQIVPEQIKTDLLDMIRKLDHNQLEPQSQPSGQYKTKNFQQQPSQPTIHEQQQDQVQSSTESVSNISLL